ncbi:THOC2 [Lepeophtheirus salmonis]|uniref:THO complex subunit 2 n=1 Tax=Lepeophtheirus salmonis TaxID=72036 RepID=A0A7R8D3Y2_LEPSM|nr:THOC2 [Lepeophtheirus salmonis]CAF2988750.1 THOC2 [Lepeophtheirus salmonis]
MTTTGVTTWEFWSSWDRNGKSEFQKTFRSFLEGDGGEKEIYSLKNVENLKRLIYELIWKYLKGTLKRDQVLNAFSEMIGYHKEVASLICDILGVVDLETNQREERDRYDGLLHDAERYLSEGILKERLEIETLGESGILKNSKKFFSTVIKLKTKLFYKQQKFNLFREECEGYSKLITELNQDLSSTSPAQDLNFNFILNKRIVFRSRYSKSRPYSFNIRSSYSKPFYDLLGPEDSQIFKDAESELKSAREFVRKSVVVSTNKTEEIDLIDSSSIVPANQKFGLLEALIHVGAWSEAEIIISQLPTYYSVSQPKISHALCRLVHTTIEPLNRRYGGMSSRLRYTKYAPLKNNEAPKPCETFEDFQTVAMPMLLALGPHAYTDPILLYKALRIIKFSLGISVEENGRHLMKNSDPKSSVLYYDALTIMDEVFLPSLSLMDCNCGLAEEIWTVLKVYPYHFRYPNIQKSIKRIMQRLSKENVKPVSRQLGKLTHSSPGLLFDYILSQIQLYDNLIGPVVDALKYLTNLSFDVLGYSIIEALNNPDKDKSKHDGTKLTGILQYVANQLKSKKSLDLLIMKEIVLKMSGIEAAEEMTNEQIDAMAGGEILRSEAGSFSQVKNTKKSSQRLKDALIDNNLAVPICLLMAQQRNCVVYHETEDSHLKLVGILFDQCQDTLVQFGTFLACNMSIDDYTRRLPRMHELLTQFHVNSDLAFFLARPMFNHKISLKFEELKKQQKDWKNKSTSEKSRIHADAAIMVMEPVIDAIRPLHPSKIWEDISPQFFDNFLVINDKLMEEEKKQREHVERVMTRLREERDTWFLTRTVRLAKNETITTFLQLCLFPRCIFTSSDAIYCAKFVQVIHMLKTPNFSTLICFDRIFCDITYTVTSCTENEANRYGRFLAAMLEIVMRWHSAKEVFEKECVGYPGFVTRFRVANDAPGRGNAAGNDTVDYENYRHVCHKWHYKIAKALVVCLESKDYVQIRNALIVLTKILPYFPIITTLAGVIEKRIEKVCADEKEHRKDLYIKATSYSGQLKARKSSMLKEHEFHVVKKQGGAATTTGAGSGASPIEAPSNNTSKKEGETKTDRKSASKEMRVTQERDLKIENPPRGTVVEIPRKETKRKRKEKEAMTESLEKGIGMIWDHLNPPLIIGEVLNQVKKKTLSVVKWTTLQKSTKIKEEQKDHLVSVVPLKKKTKKEKKSETQRKRDRPIEESRDDSLKRRKDVEEKSQQNGTPDSAEKKQRTPRRTEVKSSRK